VAGKRSLKSEAHCAGAADDCGDGATHRGGGAHGAALGLCTDGAGFDAAGPLTLVRSEEQRWATSLSVIGS
jgi:hypothetical protein